MPDNKAPKLLFIINPSSGTDKIDWKQEIINFFKDKHQCYKIFELTGKDDKPGNKKEDSRIKPQKVVAVGGDGTVKMVGRRTTAYRNGAWYFTGRIRQWNGNRTGYKE